MDFNNALSDDAKLIEVLLRAGTPQTAWWIAREAGVDPENAERSLTRMTTGDTDYPVLRRLDLGPDVFEATEDDARSWT